MIGGALVLEQPVSVREELVDLHEDCVPFFVTL